MTARCTRRAREAVDTLDEPCETRRVSPAEAFWRELAGTPKAMWREPLGAELNGLGKVPVEAGWKGRGWVGPKNSAPPSEDSY